MTEFDKTRWSEKTYAYEYLDRADLQVPERRRMLEVLKSFYNHFLKGRGQNRVLDLGCGDGILVHELLKIDPGISATLIDGSEDMLERARERLAGYENLTFIRASFQELLEEDLRLPESDLAASCLAIHHLAGDEKKALFGRIHTCLKPGGRFVNLDLVLPPVKTLEGWYLQLWREEIAGDADAIQRCMEEDHYRNLDTLGDQMKALEAAGFRDVDCFYKSGIFAVYGGRR
jgi:tRNA (cmo5U34)-methyltransferase